jgi:Protein of unknown function (DUF3096)
MRGRTEKLSDLSLPCIIRDLLGPCPGCRLISGSTLPVPCDGGNIGHLSFPLRLSAGSTWPGLPPWKTNGRAESVLLPWQASIMRTQQIPEIDQMIIPISTLIVAGVSLSPLISLIAGILILIMPRLLNFIVAIYLIIIGLVGLFHL